MDIVNEYLEKHRKVENILRGKEYLAIRPLMVCRDGFKMSVQASEFHYCSPRENTGPYSEVEVGFPSERVEELMPYVDGDGSEWETVYGYVPVEVVESVIEKHRGLKGWKLKRE